MNWIGYILSWAVVILLARMILMDFIFTLLHQTYIPPSLFHHLILIYQQIDSHLYPIANSHGECPLPNPLPRLALSREFLSPPFPHYFVSGLPLMPFIRPPDNFSTLPRSSSVSKRINDAVAAISCQEHSVSNEAGA